MKFRKKTVMAISFALGTLMFATTAMAEVTTKSGYDQLKDSLKYTGKQITTGLSSYSLDMSTVIKDGSTVVYSQNTSNKYGITNRAMENVTETYDGKNKIKGYYYTDKNMQILQNLQGKDNNTSTNPDTYYVTNFTDGNKNTSWLRNPFDEGNAGDLEKIADAVVGNLRDAVVVNTKQDGTKELSGTLNNTQIPSIVNALISFQFKNTYGSENNSRFAKMPKLSKDIFIKDAKGTITTDKNGLITNALASGVLSGKDKNNEIHNLTFETLYKISNVNSTAVKKPDLSGKKTIENEATSNYDKLSNPEKYIGKYTTNITTEKDGKFIKIGEGTVNIEKINTETVSGTYEEKYIAGYDNRNKIFNFTGNFYKDKNHSPFSADLAVTDASKKAVKGYLNLNPSNPTINFAIPDSNYNGSGMYDKIFN
ncbi:hypothetical protein [Clostridium pasteurianum]|uniref:Uncharacterized protein n=1 Tax=Clostridium pasteurianum BC1 TaxID=86416 RepID=R4JXZ3_CLOPA|nr:hypothetical protein [Clostridium pasteurianum]AGK95682.1 hypothetical protein Clopa_0637 [Clostridium pasteurianum BC1]